MSYNMVILNVQDAIKWRTHEGPDSRSVLCPNGHSSVFICVGIPLWYCSMMSTLTETDKFWISELRIKKINLPTNSANYHSNSGKMAVFPLGLLIKPSRVRLTVTWDTFHFYWIETEEQWKHFLPLNAPRENDAY